MTQPLGRRDVLGAAMLATTFAVLPVRAQTTDVDHIHLWPGAAPGGIRVTVRETLTPRTAGSAVDNTTLVHVTRPALTVFRPTAPSNRAALLIAPGGGYRKISIGHEGYAVAARFAAAGYTCYVLSYRMPGDGWATGPDAPLADAQRAMRVIAARSDRDDIDPARIGVIGFSAGGHLSARLATQPELVTYPAVDAADHLSARPRAAALLYPVIRMSGPFAHRGSRDELLGRNASEERISRYDADRLVSPTTPPTFLAAAEDDATVPTDNSLAMYAALRLAKVPGELHLFEQGGHGFGLRGQAGMPSPWPALFGEWAKLHLLS